ncbi:hypothetical protein [Anaerorhabdus sp.]|jgi:hypothetical protein|uniref:hypothetical protein n=1 Tax=Anaerorhabdus sp. TaxID=1872524 RepID=UPI002FC6122B
MEIKRVNSYSDNRFTQETLNQHGAYIINDTYLVSINIISINSAIVLMDNYIYADEVIDEFRFYSEHITKFYDKNQLLIKEFNEIKLTKTNILDLQPSQFYIDIDKLNAINSFVHNENDIIIPITKIGNDLIILDGHTRMFAAIQKQISTCYVYETNADSYISDFVFEAKSRDITNCNHLTILSHIDYTQKWINYCNKYFNQQ